MRGCLQHYVIGNAAHLIRPIASLRVWRWTPNSVAPLRTFLALIRQSAATRSMSDGFSHSGRMYMTWKGGFGTAVFWRVLPVCCFLGFVTSAIHWRGYLCNPLACPSFAVTRLSTSIHRKINFAAFCLIYFEFRRKIPEIFSLLCWHRNGCDRDPVISARPRLAPISAVPVRFCILNQKHFLPHPHMLSHGGELAKTS